MAETTNIEMITYLVGHPDAALLDIITAPTPEDAAREWLQGNDLPCAVWNCEENYPEIDVEQSFDYFGECNPEMSPFEETWGEYIGPAAIKEIQHILNLAIKRYASPWYSSTGLALEVKE